MILLYLLSITTFDFFRKSSILFFPRCALQSFLSGAIMGKRSLIHLSYADHGKRACKIARRLDD